MVQKLITEVVQVQHHLDNSAKSATKKEGTTISFPLMIDPHVTTCPSKGAAGSAGASTSEGVEGSQLDDAGIGNQTVSEGGGAGVDGASEDGNEQGVSRQVTSQGCSRVFIVKGTTDSRHALLTPPVSKLLQ